jgi:hypothetical protein
MLIEIWTLSLISLLSFEMLFDCVISWLYMCVMQLTLGKLIFANFPQFSTFLEWSVRMASLCIWMGVDQTVGRAQLRRPNGKVRHPDMRDLSACFQGNASPDGVNKLSGRGPHRLYKFLGRRIFTLPHQKSLCWLLVSDFSRVFGIISPFFVFLCINLSFQVFF